MPTDEGEICLDLNDERPAGLMQGYADAEGKLSGANDKVYRTGDVASLDEDGYLTFVGRADDVFKSSDYRISPFELESVLIEHEAVAEAAIVPSPDEIRLSVPKAYILLIASAPPTRETAQSILKYTNTRLAPFKRIRRLEFVKELPKTISGKIRRNQLRRVEYQGSAADVTRGVEFHEKDVWADARCQPSTCHPERSEGPLRRHERSLAALGMTSLLQQRSPERMAMLPRPGITQNLARFVVDTRWEDIPEQARHEAKRALLNFFAVAIAGCRTEPVELALKTLAEFSGGKQATIVGRSERIDALSAAFLNGAGANVFDYCDTHLPTVVHPTAPLAPALLALAELRRVTGPQLLTAFVLGFEIECRVGAAVSPGHYPKGWHITSTCGVFGSAAGAAKLLGLDGRPGRVGARQRLDAVGGPLRMPGLAGQERQRRQCRAQRPVLGAAGGEGLLGPGRADRRRAGLARRHGRAAELGRPDRRAGRDLGGAGQFAQALSRRAS